MPPYYNFECGMAVRRTDLSILPAGKNEHLYCLPLKQYSLNLAFSGGNSKTEQPSKKKKVPKTRYGYDRVRFLTSIAHEYGLIEIVKGRFLEGTAKEYILFRFPNVDIMVANLKKNAIFWFYREEPGDDHFAILAQGKIEAEAAGAGSIWCMRGWQNQVRKILSYCPSHLAELRYHTSRFWPKRNEALSGMRHPQLAFVLDF